jgi:hypothetical protein
MPNAVLRENIKKDGKTSAKVRDGWGFHLYRAITGNLTQ